MADLRPVLLGAEDGRRPAQVPDSALHGADLALRRLAARALARMGEAARDRLLGALADEDGEVVAWSAHGLGLGCRGQEEATVRALAARAPAAPAPAAWALARALGRCGGRLAEETLVAWLGAEPFAAPAALALGDVAARRNTLAEPTLTRLVATATASPPRLESFAALGRLPRVPLAFGPGVVQAARAALAAPASPERVFAVRALARVEPLPAEVLLAVARNDAASPAERAEAVRALRGVPAGRAALQESLVEWVDLLLAAGPSGVRRAEATLLELALGAWEGELSPVLVGSLQRLGALSVAAERDARRVYALRCAAAAALAQGAYLSDGLRGCAPEGTEPWGFARLRALARRPLVGPRAQAWEDLATKAPPRVREAALPLVEGHGELGAAGRRGLAEALRSRRAGLVSVAADVLHRHPERVLLGAPRADGGSEAAPALPVETQVLEALQGALAEVWPEDRVEAQLSLMDAAATLRVPEARPYLEARRCSAVSVLRERATRHLRSLGVEPSPCEGELAAPPTAVRVGLTAPTLRFDTDAGELVVELDADAAPLTAARLVALAGAGFYDGQAVHRVVPGFVVQLGCPDGDGFGGSGELLRCETSPLPFAPLDVGIATAGRDTGSSQIFITLSRTPHLDGEYARVGRASGPWHLVGEGDRVHRVRVSP